jgi:ADP-ribose pyrophosphatase YjhB (NUDIX family)
MASRIDLNALEDFSGAVVIVPPGDGEAVEILLLKNAQNPAMFWSLVKTQAEIAIQELASAEAQAQGWARR